MPLNYRNDRLLTAAATWNGTTALILVDETTGGGNSSLDRDSAHRLQASVIGRSAYLNFTLYLVAYGAVVGVGQFNGGLGIDLDGAIPGATQVYTKTALQTDGFDNPQLGQDIQAAGHQRVVIMGQSRNACCAATARGAAARNLDVQTAPALTRGGNVATADFDYFGVNFAGWPNNANIYAGV